MLNIEQLRMFVETANTGSFSACARKVGKVQSAVSQGIANLEIDLNIILFDRTTRKPSLTPEGERLLTYARSVLKQIEEISHISSAFNQEQELNIKFALEDALLTPELCALLSSFGAKFKATTINIISSTSLDIKELLNSEQADIGLRFLEMDLETEFAQYYIGNIPFYAVCSSSHALAKFDVVSMSDLVSHRQVMLRNIKGNAMEQLPQLSNDCWTTTNFHPLQDLVAQGIGWAYLPAHLVEQSIKDGDLHKMKMSFDHKPWSPPIELLTLQHKTMKPALTWLKEEIKKLF